MNQRILNAILVLAVCTGSVYSFAATPNPIVEAAIRNGKTSYNAGDYEAAIQSFKLAYSVQADSEILYQLGKSYAMADWPVEAVEAFEGYLRATQSHITEERRREVAIAIAGQRRRTGTLVVTVTPNTAAVKVDDTLLPQNAYGTALSLRQGTHAVSVSLDGFAPQITAVQVRANRPQVVNFDLAPLPAIAPSGLLALHCPLPAVAVLLDDQKVATTPLDEPLSIPEGTHRLKLDRSGYQSQSAMVEISHGKTSRVDCRLPTLRPLTASGQLSLEFSQPKAEVLIDGTPATKSSVLPPGPHTVEVRHYGFLPWVRELHVDTGSVHHVDVPLTPRADYVRDVEMRARRQRNWSYVLGGTGLALATTALGMGLWNHGRYGDWSSERTALQRAHEVPLSDPATLEDLSRRREDVNSQLHSIQSVDILTAILGTAGGLLIGSAVWLYVTAEDPPAPRGQRASLQRRSQGHGISIDW